MFALTFQHIAIKSIAINYTHTPYSREGGYAMKRLEQPLQCIWLWSLLLYSYRDFQTRIGRSLCVDRTRTRPQWEKQDDCCIRCLPSNAWHQDSLVHNYAAFKARFVPDMLYILGVYLLRRTSINRFFLHQFYISQTFSIYTESTSMKVSFTRQT